MRNLFLFLPCTLALIAAASCGQKPESVHNGYPIGQVPFTEVKIEEDSFWGQRLKASREVTVPLAFSKCEESGRYDNFVRATRPDSTYHIGGFPFDDTDVYKTIEGASYILQTYPDKEMEAYIDSVLVLVAAAQEPDGYLNTARTMNPAHPHDWMGPERWTSVEELSHEFYNLGHMIEGAVAHFQATGKRNFLDIAIKYADCVCRNIGTGPGQLDLVPGHEIAEMAIAKLYLVTGDRKYLDQAEYFVSRRGHTSHRSAYNQTDVPVLEASEAVGHAVRAEYFYSGVADVAALTGAREYTEAIDRIWENIVTKKLYLTGGVGARYSGEAFGENYELPNLTSYCETCAAIGNVYTAYRMFLLHGDASYYDVLERTLYNGVISGVSMDGGAFFYPNPLESDGSHLRQAWFGCACCPSNISRFIPSVPGYVYAAEGRDIYVNLYAANSLTHSINGRTVRLSQSTDYPSDGAVRITIDENKAGKFRLRLRIPGWVRGEVVPGGLYTFADDNADSYKVLLNGEEIQAPLSNGYFDIDRKWKAGDRVELLMTMNTRYVKADDAVEADRGRLAVERGPLVYCVERPLEPGGELPEGVVTIEMGGQELIPYFAWNHRGRSRMQVWLEAAAFGR